ncbi:MAG TPA: alpha-2-macroglobulin family protein [Oligoflexia bacterium]|nr:alpha-2-macroglobulin family protein [Oligoflexia bacterium]
MLLFAQISKAEEVKLIKMTPSGENVDVGQEVLFEFDKKMVRLGDFKVKKAPIIFSPNLNCDWRWLSQTTLACRLNKKDRFKYATRYSVKFVDQLVSLAGEKFQKQLELSFSTEVPKIKYSHLLKWLSPNRATMLVAFNQEVDQDSLENKLFLTRLDANQQPVLDSSVVGVSLKNCGSASECKLYHSWDEMRQKAFWIIEPTKDLMLNEQYQLRALPGILGLEGSLPSELDDQALTFRTFKKFQFLGIKCSSLTQISKEEKQDYFNREEHESDFYKTIFLKPDIGVEPTTADGVILKGALCNPFGPASLIFTVPPNISSLAKGLRFDPPLFKEGAFQEDPWLNVYVDDVFNDTAATFDDSYVLFPLPLSASTKYRLTINKENLKDQFGRELAASVDISFQTGDRNPRLALPDKISVLELKSSSQLGIIPTNLKKIDLTYLTYGSANGKDSVSQIKQEVISLPDVKNLAYYFPFDARARLGGRSGILNGIFRYADNFNSVRELPFSVQVTPFAAHFKKGYFNSLAWITDLATGKPVKGAKVSLVTFEKDENENLYNAFNWKFRSQTTLLSETVSDEFGVAELAGAQSLPNYDHAKELVLKVSKDGETAFLPINYGFRVSLEDKYSFVRSQKDRSVAWGYTAQGIYKPGEKVAFKMFLREQENLGFKLPPAGQYLLRLTDSAHNLIAEIAQVEPSQFGSINGEFRLPNSAAVGWYEIEVVELKKDSQNLIRRISFLVADYVPAPFATKVSLNKSAVFPGEDLSIETYGLFHSGGPFKGAPVKTAINFEARQFKPRNPRLNGFSFDFSDYFEAESEPTSLLFAQRSGYLGENGDFHIDQKISAADIKAPYGEVIVESSISDDRGASTSGRATATYFGQKNFIGFKSKEWFFQVGKSSAIDVVVVDQDGNLATGIPFAIEVQKLERFAVRAKSSGDSYVSDATERWQTISSCELVSAAEPVKCDFTLNAAGEVRFVGSFKENKNAPAQTFLRSYGVGAGDVYWSSHSSHWVDLVPERKDYKVGETARFILKNPFVGARALLTVERLGVISRRELTLSSPVEIISLPITAQMYPQAYVSVLLFSPRVADAPIAGEVDLGKPTFRIGGADINVEDPDRLLQVKISPEREVYKPRDQVKLTVKVAAANHQALGKPVEVGLVVIDEAVLALNSKGLKYYDPLQDYFNGATFEIENYNLLLKLVGLRNFHKKGANPGGGGMDRNISLRDVFKSVAYWNPAIITDSSGLAEAFFELPDNLTGWRAIAVVADKDDRFGLGSTAFKVNQDIEIRPALPNHLRQGDQLKAKFTVLNRESQIGDYVVNALVQYPSGLKKTFEETLSIKPFERQEFVFDLLAEEVGEVLIRVVASKSKSNAKDDLLARLNVLPLQAEEFSVVAGSLEKEGSEAVAIQIPSDAKNNQARLLAQASPSLLSAFEQLISFARDYPYDCWEQKISRAYLAAVYLKLTEGGSDRRLAATWPKAREFLLETLSQISDYQATSGGIGFYSKDSRYVSPYLSGYTLMLSSKFAELGHKFSSDSITKLNSYISGLLQESQLSPENRAMLSTFLAEAGDGDLSLLSQLFDYAEQAGIGAKVDLLSGWTKLNGDAMAAQRLISDVLALAEDRGTTVNFKFSDNESPLYSNLKLNCRILSLIALPEIRARYKISEDLPIKLAASINQLLAQRVKFLDTNSAVYCGAALVDYAKFYELKAPNYNFSFQLDRDSSPMLTGSFKSFFNSPLLGENLLIGGSADTPSGGRSLLINKRGADGRLYYQLTLNYQPEHAPSKVNAGIEVHREYSVKRGGAFHVLRSGEEVSTGDLIKVDLLITLPKSGNFVVVDDPVIGALQPLDFELATAAVSDLRDALDLPTVGTTINPALITTQFDSDAYMYGFYRKDLKLANVKYYSEAVSAGQHHLYYLAQVVAKGDFQAPLAFAQEMYAPHIFGSSEPFFLKVR